MTYQEDVDPQRITRAMRNNVEALSSTADMIDVLVEEAERQIHLLQQHVETYSKVNVGDWRIIKTFLRLAAAQAEIVKNTADDFREYKMPVLS
jgi:uncharacterized protein HemX